MVQEFPKTVPLKLKGKVIGEAVVGTQGDVVAHVTDAEAAVELGYHDVGGVSLYVERDKSIVVNEERKPK